MRRGGSKIHSEERNGFVALKGRIECMDGEGMVDAALASEKQLPSFKAWHKVLDHIDAGAINQLEKRGLLEISYSIVASRRRCAACRKSK